MNFLMLLINVLSIVAVLYMVVKHGAVMFGMEVSLFDYTSQGKVDLLQYMVRERQYWGSKLGQLVAPEYIKKTGGEYVVNNLTNNNVTFTQSPIEVFEEFIAQGQVSMRLPIAVSLTGMPAAHGDNPITGNEERQFLAWRQVEINETDHAANPVQGMSRQLIKKIAEAKVMQAAYQLKDWLNRYHVGGTILSGILTGASRDLLMPTAKGGRAVTSISHPNFIVAGHGFVDYSAGRPGTAGYEAAIESYVDGLDDETTEGFSYALVRNMVLEAPKKKIQPLVTKNGKPFYPIFCSLSQWAQLLADPDFQKFALNGIHTASLADHFLGNLSEAFIEGAAIIPDVTLWGLRTAALAAGGLADSTVTAGTVRYGPKPDATLAVAGAPYGNFLRERDTNDRKVAILVGRGMLSIGIGERWVLEDQKLDYGKVKGVAIKGIHSCVRNDNFDKDGGITDPDGTLLTAGQFLENTGSLVAATYSPDQLAY